MYSLGIRHVGETTAKDIAKHIGTFEAIRHATYEELLAVEGVGEKVAQSLVDYFKDTANQKALDELLKEITVSEEKKYKVASSQVCHLLLLGHFQHFHVMMQKHSSKNMVASNSQCF